ncbi:CapA family protein [Lachnospiraceae bacterium 38-10]
MQSYKRFFIGGLMIAVLILGIKSAGRFGVGPEDAASTEHVVPEEKGEAGSKGEEPAELMRADMPIERTDNLTETSEEPVGYDIVLSFAGDVCFADSCAVMQDYIGQGEKLENNIAPEMLCLMRDADVCWINNEFAYSDRGIPLENKMYTFRADPKRVSMLGEMGVDIAGLANNHVYDFGPEAMEDTMDALRLVGIDYVGAGRNLEEAMTPVFREIDGIKIAYVAASRAEKYKMTPQATESKAGILRCYDTELFLEAIHRAKQEADYVIALVHWGTEYSTELEEVQVVTGREYIDAGADIVIGAHTHCLQGMEYYQGKPIIYSLGNFWFNDKSLDTMLLQIHLAGADRTSEITAGNVEIQIIPARQENCKTRMLEGEEGEQLFDYLEGISMGIEIDREGIVREICSGIR